MKNPKTRGAYRNSIGPYRRRIVMRILELAWAIGRAPRTVGRWECGRANPPLESALAMAAALECPVEVLYLDQYQQIRKVVRKRLANLPRRPPSFRSSPLMWAALTLDGGETP